LEKKVNLNNGHIYFHDYVSLILLSTTTPRFKCGVGADTMGDGYTVYV